MLEDLAVALLVVLGLAVVLLGRWEQGSGGALPLRYLTAAVAWSVAAVWFARGLLPLGELRWGLVLLGTFGVLAAIFANEAVAARLGAANSNRMEAAEALAASQRAGLFVLMVAVAPVFEELLFRGLLFETVEPVGIPLALLVTAVVFALSHFDRRGFVGLFASGLIFATLRAMTGGLATPLVAHALANGFGFVMFLIQSREDRRPKASDEAPDDAGELPQSVE